MINENPVLDNRNTLYLGRSGAGKSQALKQNPAIPAAGARVVLFDPNADHAAHRFNDRAGFARALARADQSGQGFRIAYTGDASPAIHEWWCECVCAILDGKKTTIVIDEEIASSCSRAGTADPAFRRLLNQGRKYGMQYHGTSQRPQEIPKTAYENCLVLFVGALKKHSAAYVAKELEVSPESIANLPNLTFYKLDAKAGRVPVLINLQYRKG